MSFSVNKLLGLLTLFFVKIESSDERMLDKKSELPCKNLIESINLKQPYGLDIKFSLV